MKLTVDRIEKNIAVVETENKETLNVPIAILGEIAEGDVITVTVQKEDKTKTCNTHSIFEKLRNKSKSDI